MKHNTILHISDRANISGSVLAALKETGCEVVSTNSPIEAVALLYIMHSVAAVVLDNRAREQASFDVAQSLRTIAPDVPIVLLCRDQIDRLPPFVDSCVRTSQPPERLTSEVQSLLTAKAYPGPGVASGAAC
jgi:CheY-like chemotaxis protein